MASMVEILLNRFRIIPQNDTTIINTLHAISKGKMFSIIPFGATPKYSLILF